jgi:RimJ/RimL family protein N-acetyltransferase
MTDDLVEPWYRFTLPPLLETTRLVLRAPNPTRAVALKRAIDSNLDHLRAWMPWAMNEPSPLGVVETRLERFAAGFETGPDWTYNVSPRDSEAIIGAVGIHASIGPNALEIGYWLDGRSTGRGLATEATGAVVKMALALPDVERIEIRCDPRNVASAGIPQRLGFRHVTTLEKNTTTPTGDPRDTMVWELTRESLTAREQRP